MGFRGQWSSYSNSPHRITPWEPFSRKLDFYWFLALPHPLRPLHGVSGPMELIFELPASNYPLGTVFPKTRFLLVPSLTPPPQTPPWGFGANGAHIRTPRIELPLGNRFPENSISIGS